MPEILPDAPRTPRRRARAVAAAVVFVGLLTVGGWWAGRDLTAAVPPAGPSLGGARLFDQVVAAVAQKYVDSLDASAIYDKAVTGMLQELQDPFTSFLSDERLRRLNEQMSGTYAGVGLQVDIRDGWPVVIEPISGGPSEQAGLLAGDRLIEINKESTKGWQREETSRALRGAPGSTVTVAVARGDQRLTFSLVRDKVHIRAVQRVMREAPAGQRPGIAVHEADAQCADLRHRMHRQRGQRRALRDQAQRLRAGMALVPQGLPARVIAALVVVNELLRGLHRDVNSLERDIGEERLVPIG